MKVTDNQGGFINMRPITTVRVAMMVLWLAMMVIDWDIIWMCLFCVTAVDIYDSIDRMDY